MIIIGITGPIGHGKTTLADALAKHVAQTCRFESFLIIAEVADALHAALQAIPDDSDIDALNRWLQALPVILEETVHANCTFDQIRLDQAEIQAKPVEYEKLFQHLQTLRQRPELAHQPITKENKETYRPFLQWIGGTVAKKVDQGIWYREIIRRAHAAAAEGCELCIVSGIRFPVDAAILREAGGKILKIYRPGFIQNDIRDLTERERDAVEPDTTIMNNGTIEDLEAFAPHLLEAIPGNRLETLYKIKA